MYNTSRDNTVEVKKKNSYMTATFGYFGLLQLVPVT